MDDSFDEKENSTTTEFEGNSDKENPSAVSDGGESGDNSQTPTAEELAEKNKQLWARLQKTEKKLKEREQGGDSKAVQPDNTQQVQDPLEMAKLVSQLSQYSPEEIDYIKLISSAKGIPPQEALNTDEVKLYIQARREKVEKESKNLPPSSRQPSSEKPLSELSNEEVSKLSDDERTKYFVEKGVLPKEYLPKK